MEDRRGALRAARWTRQATRHLEEIRGFIAQDNPVAAQKLVKAILDRVETLRVFPACGRRVPETPHRDAREIFFQNYRIMYHVTTDRVHVLAVLERHRRPPPDGFSRS